MFYSVVIRNYNRSMVVPGWLYRPSFLGARNEKGLYSLRREFDIS